MEFFTSKQNSILQKFYPLFIIQDFDSLVKSSSKAQQKDYYNNYNQFCQDQSEELQENLLTFNLHVIKSETDFLKLVEQFVVFPDLIQVPKFKYFKACLEEFFVLTISVVSTLKKKLRSINNFDAIPKTSKLIEFLLHNIIPSNILSNKIQNKISNAVSDLMSRSLKTIFSVIIQILIDSHLTVLDRVITKHNYSVLNEMVSSVSDAIETVFEKFVIKQSMDSSSSQQQSLLLRQSPLNEEQQLRIGKIIALSEPIQIALSINVIDPITIITPTTTMNYGKLIELPQEQPTSRIDTSIFDYNISIFDSPSCSSYSLHLTLKYNSKSFNLLLRIFYYNNSFQIKVKWLETLSHRPNIVASDVVSTG